MPPTVTNLEETRLYRIVLLIREFWAQALSIAAAALGFWTDFFFSEPLTPFWRWGIPITATGLYITGEYARRRHAQRIHALENENRTLNLRLTNALDAAKADLRHQARTLLQGLNLWASDIRISVYGHQGRRFYLIARTSLNPELAEPGRPNYPDDIGFLGEAWRKGHYAKAWGTPGNARRNAEKLGYDSRLYDSVSLRPLSVVALRIDNAEHFPVGIVLIEWVGKTEDEKPPAVLDDCKNSPIFRSLQQAAIAFEPIFEAVSISDN